MDAIHSGALAAAEAEVLAGLDDVYDLLSGQALKEIRRALPVTGKKLNWATLVTEFRLKRSAAAENRAKMGL